MRKKTIFLLSLLPFFRIILKLLYNLAIKKVKILAVNNPEIIDILLISKMKDHDFIYGSSDLNIVFIVEKNVYPKIFLKEVRKALFGIWPANVFVDIENLRVLKETEIKTPLIRSLLVSRYDHDDVTWTSIITGKDFNFRLKEQDHYSIQQSYIRNIENYLLNPKTIMVNRHWIRSFGKNIYQSVKGLIRYNLIHTEVLQTWERLGKKLIRFSFISHFHYQKMKILSFQMLDFEVITQNEYEDTGEEYPANLIKFGETLLQYPIIEDIIFNPALIQLDHEEVKGKIFIDIVLGQSHSGFTSDRLVHIQNFINEFQASTNSDEPKYVFRYTTYGLIKLKAEQVLQSYPLEYFYHVSQSYSLNKVKYQFDINLKQVERACVYYLLHEFMRFRSLEQKNTMIGSRFIKSLNIIYRYQLLLNYLRGQEFAVSHSYRSILEELTPQLSDISPEDEVDQELWRLIRSQMLFILKRIRDELAKKNPSLKNLQF